MDCFYLIVWASKKQKLIMRWEIMETKLTDNIPETDFLKTYFEILKKQGVNVEGMFKKDFKETG